ncbi:MAG: TIGR01244 family phosphatase [Beijerinckiaceae bacterium]|nr:TIGR01244 family phosphatase [Beijerinckiaceae bacterium]
MTPKIIDPTLSVSEQIKPEDIAAIVSSGFKSIICNRPDGEAVDQPAFAKIETAAKAAGLSAAYQPVVSGKVSDEDSLAFGSLMDALPKPVFAYCKTGTRSTTLWSLSEAARGRPLPDILATTKAAGYDMTDVVQRIAQANLSPLPDQDG